MPVVGLLSKFDQCVLNMALIHLCNSESHVGQEMRHQYNAWKQDTDTPVHNPWLDIHQFTIYIPHPDQQYEGITLEAGLSQGYNVEVEPVKDPSSLIYDIRQGSHFVAVFKQKQVDGDFAIAATGIFVRSLALVSLDVVVDLMEGDTEPIVVRHPIIRDYPQDWETTLRQFLQHEIRDEALPRLVGYVDQSLNRDYRSPDWRDIYQAGNGLLSL
ncbi:MAG: hypothetical protein VKJ64_20120 [Leptolyngbyaceae bacterium]|nr:hypothetical protein [Leptolyngbyaceae bacterium]